MGNMGNIGTTCRNVKKSSDYTTGDLLDYLYHQNYYKLIRRDLWRQKNMSIAQQIGFTGKLDKDDGGKMFFLSLKSSKKIF